MAQSNLADCLPTDSAEENERQTETSGDNDAGVKAEVKIRHVRDKALEVSPDVECPRHLNENAAGGDQEFSQLGPIILGEIRDKFLFMVGAAGTKDTSERFVINMGASPFYIMAKGNKKRELKWSPGRERLSNEVVDAIRGAWPRHRNVKGVEQIILESDGTTPARVASWGSVDEGFQQRYDELRRQRIDDKRLSDCSFSAYETLWHKWCLDAAESVQRKHERSSPGHVDNLSPPSKFRGQIIYCDLEKYKKEEHMFPLDQLASVLSYDEPFPLPPSEWGLMVFYLGGLLLFLRRDFQSGLDYHILTSENILLRLRFRYFRPIYGDRTREEKVRYPCVLGDRQRAIIGPKRYLEEKRALLSLRVSPLFPGLFNIFILADEYMSPTAKDWNLGLEGELNEPNWALYGLKPCGRGTAITHYMFEVSRVLERSLDSWSDALTWIDTLVHVNLSDFEDAKHVEDLMFDKSFTRSKDYFVAIQLLRIMDEWLDELLLGIEDLRSCLAMKHPIFSVDEAQDNINFAIKSMKERTTRFQGRVRKKSEEIKSLRDGLFNATSLREATKAMALNQAIYIFTVVTVLFTPVSFLATFWALPFLNNPVEEGSDMVPEPKAFRSSFIAMPLLTYTLVIGIAWYMRPNQSRYTVPVWLVDMWDITREVLDSAWEKISLKGKRTQRNSQEGYDTEEDV